MAELEGMAAEEPEPPPVDAEAAASARLAEIAELEAKLAARKMQKETSEAHRQAVHAMPDRAQGHASGPPRRRRRPDCWRG